MLTSLLNARHSGVVEKNCLAASERFMTLAYVRFDAESGH